MFAFIAIAAAVSSAQCNRMSIDRMIDRYAGLVRHQQGDSIAKLFGADGEIDNSGAAPVRGEAAIGKLLNSFKGAVVKSEALTIATVDREGQDWRVDGRFHQTGRSPDGKDYDVSGTYQSTWTCGADGWRVRRMSTGR